MRGDRAGCSSRSTGTQSTQGHGGIRVNDRRSTPARSASLKDPPPRAPNARGRGSKLPDTLKEEKANNNANNPGKTVGGRVTLT